MEKCAYGCNSIAIYQFKNKKWCCSKNVNACKGKRNKDSLKKKGINIFAGKTHPRGFLGKEPWNKGLIDDPRCQNLKLKGLIFGSNINGHTQETKDKLSLIAKSNQLGGYVHNSGRGKKGKCRGFFFDSSWELAWIVYMLDHDIYFRRNYEKFSYVFNDNTKFYIPDFILEDNTYIEIKGYMTEQWNAKIKSFPFPIKVLDKTNIVMYIEYAKAKYGKNFVEVLRD